MSVCYKVIASAWSILLRSVQRFTPTDHLKATLSVQSIDLLVHCYVSHINKRIFLFKEESKLHTHVRNSQIWAASVIEAFPVFRLTVWLPSSG